MIGLKLLITGYLENTLRYTTPFNNAENSVMAQVLIYLSKECHHQHFGKLHPTIEDRQFQAMHFLRELRDNIKRIWHSCLIFATSVDGLAYWFVNYYLVRAFSVLFHFMSRFLLGSMRLLSCKDLS